MDKIGKYEVLEKIGTGGFGVVFKGRDPFIKRFVAIKTCSSEAEDVRRRFYREAEIAGNLQHRNVVTVYDFGEVDEVPYLVQEYLPGEDLDQLILRRALTDDVKLDYLLQIATGLEYAHAQGVIHRDIKPSNVRVVDGGRVKIMDFGIAKLANLESQLTKTGMTLGTASYLAPEQIRGEDLTHAADIFSYGVLAYELFAHRRPFEGQSLSNLFYQILSAEPPPLDSMAAGCPPQLAAIVQRCLDKDPAKRWRDCGELLAALEPLREAMATSHEAERTQVLGGVESGPTVSLTASAAGRELATVEAKVGELLAAGDATAAEIEVTLARKRFAATPQAAKVLGALGERIAGERGRRDEQRRQAEKLDAFVARGRELLRAGEHAEAALVLRAALDVDPGHRAAAALLDEVEAAVAAAERARQAEQERRRREEEEQRRQVADAVGEVDALIAGGDLRGADRAWRRASSRLGDRPEVAAARERLEGARAAAEAEAAAREQARLEAARAAAAEKVAARERARAEADERARQKREAAERAQAEREAARRREREEAAALAREREREKAEAARLAAEERARQKAEGARLEAERQARLRAEREAREAEEARRQEEEGERQRAAAARRREEQAAREAEGARRSEAAAAATALGGAGAVGEESAAYSVGARERWRWAVVAAAGIAAIVLLGVWWSGARAGDPAQPISAAAEPAGVPAAIPIPPAPGPAVDPPASDPAATLVPPGPAGPEPTVQLPAPAGLDAATRTLLANGRRALARGDVAAALAPAEDAWRRAGDDPDVQALARDLTAAAGRAAALAQREATAAGAGELAAGQASAAARARSEGDRLAGQPGPAGAQALWRSAVLYRGAAQAAREEGERRERAREEESRRAAAAPPPAPAPTTAARQPDPPARPAPESRPAAPAPAPRPAEESAGVEAAIGRYRAASEALDAGAVQAVWPSAPGGTLRRSFANYASLDMRITGCETQVQGSSATAVCWRDQEVRLKAGRSPDPTRQRVRFRLRRAGDGWLIDSLEAL